MRASRVIRSRAVALLFAQATSGVATYVLHVLAGRALAPRGYGHFGLFFTTVLLASQLLFVPFQYAAMHFVPAALARGEAPADAWARIARPVGITVVVVTAAGAAVASPMADVLFGGDRALALLLVIAVNVYAAVLIVRGLLWALGTPLDLALSLVSDSLVRLAIAATLALVVGLTTRGVAAAYVVGAMASAGAFLPGRHRLGRLLRAGDRALVPQGAVVRFAWPLFAVNGAQQALLNASPLVVQLAGPSDRAGLPSFVACLVLTRIPQYVLAPVVTNLLPVLSARVAEGAWSTVRRDVRIAALTGAAFVAALAGVGLVAGPSLLRLVYGPGYSIQASVFGLLAASCGAAVVADAANLALVSMGRARGVLLPWVTALAVATLMVVLLPGSAAVAAGAAMFAAFAVAAVTLGFRVAAAVNAMS